MSNYATTSLPEPQINQIFLEWGRNSPQPGKTGFAGASVFGMGAIRVAATVVVITLMAGDPQVLAVSESGRWELPSIAVETLHPSLASQLSIYLSRRTGLVPAALHHAATLEEGGGDRQLRIAFYGLLHSWYTNAEGAGWVDVYSLFPGADARQRASAPPEPLEFSTADRDLVARVLDQLRIDVLTRPVLAVLSPKTFTLSYLQELVESVQGRSLHTQNFRRYIRDTGLVEPAGMLVNTGSGRPAELFSFPPPGPREG